MPRPRTPLAKARLLGRDKVNPGRYKVRAEPKVTDPVGEPFDWLKPEAREAWREFARDIPWLNHSHRGHVAVTSLLAGRLRMGKLCDGGMKLYQVCLGKMGATPADFSKVGWSPPGDDEPGAEYFR